MFKSICDKFFDYLDWGLRSYFFVGANLGFCIVAILSGNPVWLTAQVAALGFQLWAFLRKGA